MKPPVKFEWKGNHHGYYGVFLMVFGAFNWYMGIDNGQLVDLIPLWKSFLGVGAFMLIDDIVEHTLTGSTPLRLIYRFLYKTDE